MHNKRNSLEAINAGSMADIAFLLLIFFLVTTTIASDQGLQILLPPDERSEAQVNANNVFQVLVNSRDALLVEDEPMPLSELRAEAKAFLTNQGQDPRLSDSPQKAVIALKTDRGTSYAAYIQVLNEVKAAYHELRAEQMGITLEDYLNFDEKKANPALIQKMEAAQAAFPMRISESEPTEIAS